MTCVVPWHSREGLCWCYVRSIWIVRQMPLKRGSVAALHIRVPNTAGFEGPVVCYLARERRQCGRGLADGVEASMLRCNQSGLAVLRMQA